MPGLLETIRYDMRCKAQWCYESTAARSIVKVLLTDGTTAMLIYRLMQWSGRHGLWPLEMLFNKLNAVLNHCIIGRGAQFGPGFVLIHATGVIINGDVRGGSRIYIEHQVTIGADNRCSPVLQSDVFIGAGARVIGNVKVGEWTRIGANAVVVEDVPDHCTVAGVPAKVVRRRAPIVPAIEKPVVAQLTPSLVPKSSTFNQADHP
jgi:serine O-acetyltransferase